MAATAASDALVVSAAASPSTDAAAPGKPYLRDLPQSAEFFSKPTWSEHQSLQVYDRDTSGSRRSLPKNELLTMALNEIAVARGRGFFLYLPNRHSFKTQTGERRKPLEPPGADFPSLLYMNFVWDSRYQQAFQQETHRERYLKCDALINPPLANMPLYGVQVVDGPRAATYTTRRESLIIIHSIPAVYLITTAALKAKVGRWSRRRPRGADPDPDLRIQIPSEIWADDTLSQFADEKMSNLTLLYEHLVAYCHPGSLAPSFTWGKLVDLMPRPVPSGGDLSAALHASASAARSRKRLRQRRNQNQEQRADEQEYSEGVDSAT